MLHIKSPKQKLEENLEELAALLTKHGVSHWAQWVAGDLELVKAGNLRGIEHLLSAYGGMGSLNDVHICPQNGHNIKEDEIHSVNDQFLKLTSKVYDLATNIQRKIE